MDWAAADAGLLAWTRELLRIRRDYPVLHADRFLTGLPATSACCPMWSGATPPAR